MQNLGLVLKIRGMAYTTKSQILLVLMKKLQANSAILLFADAIFFVHVFCTGVYTDVVDNLNIKNTNYSIMKTDELPNIPEEDDISIIVEQLKNRLVARATGKGDDFTQKEYSRLRKIVLGIPDIKEMIPRFLKTCRSLDEFWTFIKGVSPQYTGRREFLGDTFNPIIEKVEYEIGEGALEFKKNYKEIDVIGHGGFGLVYLYEHRLLQLPFAVKVFAPAFYKGGEKELERFFQEARMLFSLNHPNIIKVYDAGMIGKRPFIRMEYFDGYNLNQVLLKYGSQTPSKALQLIRNITEGLEHAHEEIGIIHRDLKPSNIMISGSDNFRIIDFGLGIFIENELHSRITKTNEKAANGLFNAPELLKNPKLIDKRSDIYSLGAIWFNVLTGQPPAGTTIVKELEVIEGITPLYVDCISRCLAGIDERFSNCSELLLAIKKLNEEINSEK